MPKKRKKIAKKDTRAEIVKRTKAKAAADQKAKHTAVIIELKPLAKTINTMLKTAGEFDGKADDKRLTAAISLEQARVKCDKAKLSFKKWVDDNVIQGFSEVSKLVAIGASKDPAKAISDMRSGAAKRMKRMRSNKAAAASRDAAAKSLSPYEGAEAGLAMLNDRHARILIENKAGVLGLKVVSKKDAEKIKQVERDQPSEFATVEEVKTAFRTLKASDKLEFVRWSGAIIGVTIAGDFQDDSGDVPAKFKRKRKSSPSGDVVAA